MMSGATLTWDEIVRVCSRIIERPAPLARETMLDVVILPPLSDRPVEATVVPTRMHEPGFYVRGRTGTPNWAFWMLRSDSDLAMFRRFVDLDRVTRA